MKLVLSSLLFTCILLPKLYAQDLKFLSDDNMTNCKSHLAPIIDQDIQAKTKELDGWKKYGADYEKQKAQAQNELNQLVSNKTNIDQLVTERTSKWGGYHSQMKNLYKEDLIPPVRDQDSIGWCYASSSADLLNHYMAVKKLAPYKTGDFEKKNLESLISPVGIAHQYNREKADKAYDKEVADGKFANDQIKKDFVSVADGGDIDVALKIALDRGVCFENELPSEDGFIPELKKATKGIEEISGYNRTDNLRTHFNNIYYGTCDAYQSTLILFPELKNQDSDVKKILSTLKGREAIKALTALGCSKKNKIDPKPKVKIVKAVDLKSTPDGFLFKNNDKVMEELDSALDKGTIAAIDYDAGTFMDRAESGSLKYPHNSVVVGRTLDKNCSPVYVLKNSYGEHLAGTPSPCEALIKANKKLSCEGGYIFVPVDELKKSVSTVTYLE